MKRQIAMACLLASLVAAPLLGHTVPAYAGNSSVEASLRNYGDVSMFYQALLTTGVINELNENSHYTIFAPTNAAFSEINPQTYPCFYSEQCRPQIANMLRDHIIAGDYSLADLATYGQGIQTLGPRRLVVSEEYVGKYQVNGQDILNNGETAPNAIYRINGVVTDPQELAQFRTVTPAPSVIPAADTVTQRTTTQRTYQYVPDSPSPYAGGTMDPTPDNPQDNMNETTTITKSYTTEE